MLEINLNPDQILFLKTKKITKEPLRVQVLKAISFNVHHAGWSKPKEITVEHGTLYISKNKNNTVTVVCKHTDPFITEITWDFCQEIKNILLPVEVYQI